MELELWKIAIIGAVAVGVMRFLMIRLEGTSDNQQETELEPSVQLTEEELKDRVFELLADDTSNLTIAETLGISAVRASMLTSELIDNFRLESKAELIELAKQKKGH